MRDSKIWLPGVTAEQVQEIVDLIRDPARSIHAEVVTSKEMVGISMIAKDNELDRVRQIAVSLWKDKAGTITGPYIF